jgi:hypothetical protein
MKPLISWLLKKTGIYNFVWNDFCREYPVRIKGETPELQKFMEVNNKAFTDMLVYGMGCTQYVDPKTVMPAKVLH